MFLQMPVLFSLFNVFRGSIELRQSEFILWIVDLSKPDSLPVGGFDLHVLPLAMAASMFFQSKMTMKDPKQAMLVYIMPVFMTWIFWSMSSGLVLYFTMFNLLTLLQQRVMERTKRVLGTQ
jgi:YidC/Oxa1 family membrane protein insertase